MRERRAAPATSPVVAAGARPSSALDSVDPPRNFSVSTDDRVRALAVGVPAYAARKRRIEDAHESFVATLVALHDELTARRLPAHAREAAVLAEARTFDLGPVNRLIEAHNRYYPIEADLPIDPISGVFLLREDPWQPEPALSPESLAASACSRVAARTA